MKPRFRESSSEHAYTKPNELFSVRKSGFMNQSSPKRLAYEFFKLECEFMVVLPKTGPSQRGK